ncbi:MAG: tRNA (adenosine(37)-N6)-dimethylallyltransferase MiaA [Pseudomonadales bacterium]|nr:tRNA (adenosine(37)-N6)-dimethylallyltransferase MiaA [Pseudomonadales bacterium]NIX07117.1 tRNA (adenosine(37)-N6)-dimethylallyltransferase MiaA [Pseudomonadales bacterium]
MARQASAPLVLVITGPTAVGKTELAIEIARRVPVSLISMDSALVYRGMDIGTAKPSARSLKEFPQALIDIRDPKDPYSAADFVRDADSLIREAWSAGRVPLIVGGTMMYLRAFREGLADLPEADPELRQAIVDEAASRGWAALHETLRAVDPVAASVIHPNNPQRLQRALEVHRLTGRPISDFWLEQRNADFAARLGGRMETIALMPEAREQLHDRIARRFAAMLEQGLVEEVRRLRARGDLHLDLPSIRAVGYRQVWQHLEGELDAAEMEARACAATRQLAKRQLTWLRGWSSVRKLAWGDVAATVEDVLQRVDHPGGPA